MTGNISGIVAKELLPENPYLLLTPGPLSTTKSVKAAMLKDWCTWDNDYNGLVEVIRERLLGLATKRSHGLTSILLQGSGTYCVEALIGSTVPHDGKLLILANGAYGMRMARIASVLNIPHNVIESAETKLPDIDTVRKTLQQDDSITHVAIVHVETTTGMRNPIEAISKVVKENGKVFIVDAMSSFGGIEMDVEDLGIDYLVSSANKCIQGVPGFGFIIAKQKELIQCRGRARSLSLDIYDQWETMEMEHGKWRFTSPTHVVRAFYQALLELDDEGGIRERNKRYRENHSILVKGMEALGFQCLLPAEFRSPIITSFFSPGEPSYNFTAFYQEIKRRGFVIYPGKVTNIDTFRIGTIGDVYPEDMERLIRTIKETIFW